jgi:type I restriction enzyme S subunit
MEAVCAISGSISDAETVAAEEVLKGYTPFEDGDLIWAKITPCMENGKSAVARNLLNGVGFGSTEFHVLRVNNSAKLLPDYLWVLLRLASIRQAAVRYFVGSAGQQRVPASFLEGLEIPLPPIGEQRLIVRNVQKQRSKVARERAALAAMREERISSIERIFLDPN